MSAGSRLPVARLAGLFALVALVPLGLLTYFSLTLAGDAVRREVERRVASSSALSAQVVQEEMHGLANLVGSYADRPSLIDALGGPTLGPADRRSIRAQLDQLRGAHDGIYTAFVVGSDGRLIDIVPKTPGIIGKDFSFRDWYRGATRTGRPYVSEAFRGQAAGTPLVVAAAAPVRVGNRRGRTLAVLGTASTLDHVQHLVDGFAAAQGVRLKVTDQRGVLVAEPGRPQDRLVSRLGDPRVRAALGGRSGLLELDTPDGRRLSAYTPVPEIGWTVTASVPANTALVAVSDLRSAVLSIAGVLALVLFAGLVLLIHQLRRRRRAEEDASRLASINRTVLDATPAGILLVDPQGRKLVENAAMRELSEGTPQDPSATVYEGAERNAEKLVDPKNFQWLMSEVASDPDREASTQLEARDGRSFHLYTGPVREALGGLVGRIFVLRDQTAEHEAERLKSELVATVSHELRTPLASILGFAELLSERELDVPTRKAYTATIYSEATRLTTLINDFLDLQRIEAGSFSLSLEPFSLDELLAEQVELFSGQSSELGLELDPLDGALNVLAERDRIAQVVGNLLSNAIKYSPRGGSIVVRAEEVENGVRVSVRDEGLGIPVDQQDKLFTKFFRVDTSDTREIGGTGLGLALCREIVEAHGGHMGVDSVEGEGSTFWFLLPSETSRGVGGGGRILVVEDDAGAAGLLTEYIAAGGYTVEAVTTGEQALARAFEDPPAAICLDMVLPGELDGWDVLARLKASPATARIPVVVCTGRNGRPQAAALGAADFLTKPFSRQQIEEAIGRVLPQGHGSLLIVDDDPSVRRLVRATLDANGFKFREAADGAEALEEIRRQKPDALILDLMMPGVDGFAVLEELQADPETRRLPVVVLTARRLSGEERDLLRDRTISLLEKSSYSADELRRLIERAVTHQ